jgi:hypothetical protein
LALSEYLHTTGKPLSKIPHRVLTNIQDEEDVQLEGAPVTPTGIEGENSTVVPAAAIAALSDSEELQKTIDPIVKSVVAIRFCWVRLSVVFRGPEGEVIRYACGLKGGGGG